MVTRITPAGNQVPNTPAPAAFANGVAGGWIGYVSTTTPQSTGGAEATLTGLTVTVTVNASRRIRIWGYVPTGGYGTGASGERTIIRIKESSTILQVSSVISVTSGGTNIQGVAQPVTIETPSTGAHTYSLSIEGLTAVSANTPVTTAPTADRPCWLLVEDIGPSA